MRSLKHPIALMIAMCLNVIASAQSTKVADEQVSTRLNKFRTDYIKSMVDKNPELLTSYYAEDIRLMPEFQKTVMGKSNVLIYHKAFSTRFDIKSYTRKETEILNLGKRMVEFGMFTMNVELKSTGVAYDVDGKYQNIWEKSGTHELKLITEAWNYNHALEFEELLRFPGVPTVDVALQAHAPISSDISFELAALNGLMEITIMQHDAKIWSKFYADDAKFIYSRHPVYEGRKAVDDFLEKHVRDDMPVFEQLDIRNDRIDDLGTFIIEYASHIANWRQGESSGVNTGKDIRIWRRQPGGSLKIYRAMAMYD